MEIVWASVRPSSASENGKPLLLGRRGVQSPSMIQSFYCVSGSVTYQAHVPALIRDIHSYPLLRFQHSVRTLRSQNSRPSIWAPRRAEFQARAQETPSNHPKFNRAAFMVGRRLQLLGSEDRRGFVIPVPHRQKARLTRPQAARTFPVYKEDGEIIA